MSEEQTAAIQAELHEENLSTFADEPPSVAQGARGAAVSGYSLCRKKPRSIARFIEQLVEDIGPPIMEKIEKA